MDKNEFINQYKIKAAMPLDPSLRVIPGEGFALAIEEFINDRFRGVARVTAELESYGGVLVCSEYVASFFKALLAEIYGRCFLDITISSDKERMTILVKPDMPLPLEDKQMRNLIRLARNGGMRIFLEDGNIRLTLLFSDAALRRVYAISVYDGRKIMLGKFSEIFYSGEEYYSCEKS